MKHIPYITFTLNIYDIFTMYITYTLKIYDIVIQYKEIIFLEKYTTYSLYFKDIWYNCSTLIKVCLKHIPDIAFTLNTYTYLHCIPDEISIQTKWKLKIILHEILEQSQWHF